MLIWKKLPPGVFIAVLGFMAALYALIPTITAREKALWVLCFFLLMVLEITVLYRERNRHDKEMVQSQAESTQRFTESMCRFEQLLKASDSHAIALMRLQQVINDPADSLKKRALQLSESILDFIYGRMQDVPPLPNVKTFLSTGRLDWKNILTQSPEYAKMAGYEKATMDFYKARFLEKVVSMRHELHKQGLVDEQLEQFYSDPKESGYIRIIGERIGALAEQLSGQL